jgi:hypothetical protein
MGQMIKQPTSAIGHNPRTIWLSVFVFINIVCAIVIANSHQLLGEVAGLLVPSASDVVVITLVVILSYVVVLGILYPLLCRIKVAPIELQTGLTGKAVGRALFFLQAAFIAFFTATGIGFDLVSVLGADIGRFALFYLLRLLSGQPDVLA